MTINYDVIKKAYGFTLNTDGEVEGLVAGDMGFEGTGIKLDAESLQIWKMGLYYFCGNLLDKDKND